MLVKGFELHSQEKLDRVVLGTQGRDGSLQGGLGHYDDEGNAVDKDGKPLDEDTILAQYDKHAGYFTKDGIKVKHGAFWDFKQKKPRKEPDIWYIFPVAGGDKVEVRDPSELGKAMQTIEQAKQEKKKTFKEKKSKSKFKE